MEGGGWWWNAAASIKSECLTKILSIPLTFIKSNLLLTRNTFNSSSIITPSVSVLSLERRISKLQWSRRLNQASLCILSVTSDLQVKCSYRTVQSLSIGETCWEVNAEPIWVLQWHNFSSVPFHPAKIFVSQLLGCCGHLRFLFTTTPNPLLLNWNLGPTPVNLADRSCISLW